MDANDPNEPNATVVLRRELNPRVAIVHVRPDSGDVADFLPGQFIQVGLPAEPGPQAASETRARTKLVKRSYSIASAPREKHAFELLLALVDAGRLTPRLWSFGAGQRVWIDPVPKGIFTLEEIPPALDLVFVATGTGIAPFVSMLRHHGRDPGRVRRFVVIHGAREESDLAYDDELRAAERSDSRVRYVPVLSREHETSAWTGLRGRVQVALDDARLAGLAGAPLDPRSAHGFLSGNPEMIRDVRELLAPRGFVAGTAKTPGNVHFERYW